MMLIINPILEGNLVIYQELFKCHSPIKQFDKVKAHEDRIIMTLPTFHNNCKYY